MFALLTKRLISLVGLDISSISFKQSELSNLAAEYKVKSDRVEPLPKNVR